MTMPLNSEWGIIPNTGFPYDSNYPWLVVNVENEPTARFVSKTGALIFWGALGHWGRVIDTRPAGRKLLEGAHE